MPHVRGTALTRYCSPMSVLISWIRNPAAWLIGAAILGGCSSGQSPGAAAPGSAAAKKPAHPTDALSRTMVSAVPANKPSAVPVQVKFEVKAPPDVGQPLDIDLALVPVSGNLDRISGTVAVEEGLELIEGAQIPPTNRPAEGVPITHGIKVRPLKNGIFTFSVTLSVDTAGQTSTETFSMPLIAGAGLSSPSAKPASPTTAAH